MSQKQIAEVCHEANRALTLQLQDVPLQPHWPDVDADMKLSCATGVEYCINNPAATGEQLHAAWCVERTAQGWVRGDVKDATKKTHPALRPYAELSDGVRLKDAVFRAIVGALK